MKSMLTVQMSVVSANFFWGEETNSLHLTQKTLLLQLLLTQISKDQISGSVKFTFPVGGDTTVDFK